MNSVRKVFCLGLDGGTFDLIDSFIREGYLPNIKGLMDCGTRATLNSVILPFTPQAWGSFMTGVNPGKHGVFGFREKSDSGYAFQFVNNKTLKVKPFYKILSEAGKKVILVNIPMTYPPEEINGILISGMDSPGISSDFIFPGRLKNEILNAIGDYMIHLHVGAGYLDSDAKRRKGVKGLLKMVEAREMAVLYLMDHYSWDFFAVNFAAIDQVQHHFWRYMYYENEFKDAILTVYKRVDEAIGKIMAKLGREAILFIMSDHGAGAASNSVFFIDEWLKERGLLSFRTRAAIPALKRRIVHGLLTFLSKRLSSQHKDTLMRILPGVRIKSQGFVRRSLIDWSVTKAFSGEHPATLRINLKGRDKEGIVEDDEYEDLREGLINELEAIEDPQTGEKLIEKVYKKEALYQGPFLDKAPDLIIRTKDFAHQVKGGPYPEKTYQGILSEKDPRDFFVNGVHRLNGIFIAYGEGIRRNHSVPARSIMDLCPTILHRLGLKIPKTMDGRLITEIYHESDLAENPAQYTDYDIRRYPDLRTFQKTYEKEEESKEIEENLKGLGYID